MEEYQEWFDNDGDEDVSASLKDYEISAVPNDFNINTILDFIESGVVKIPGFQRNYVWDKKRASKLIESILIGIPIPQVFLYEKGRNDFLVIDGQQRLMTIYYFRKMRFPRKESRAELRAIFNSEGAIPDEVLFSDDYFEQFNLQLRDRFDPDNVLHGLNYNTLGDRKSAFGLRTMRNVFIKQMLPPEDDSSIFELFNRLNTGGINLRQQEIRSSLYHSEFYEMLNRVNVEPDWRRLVGLPRPDLHMKDIEYLLRGYSMLVEGDAYKGSILRHLNEFSKNAQRYKSEKISYLADLFKAFLLSCNDLEKSAFTLKTNKFNISIYESVFVGVCLPALRNNTTKVKTVTQKKLASLKSDREFLRASEAETGRKINVEKRLERARKIISR